MRSAPVRDGSRHPTARQRPGEAVGRCLFRGFRGWRHGGSEPSFPLCPAAALIALALVSSFLLPACGPPKSGRDGLPAYDRLAEEASILNRNGETERVIALLDPHKANGGNDSALFFNELGVALRRKGRLPDAVRSYRKALAIDPATPVVRKNLADALFLNGEYSEAAAQSREALRADPLFHEARSTLALSLYRLERRDEALKEFEAVLASDPGDEQARRFIEALGGKGPRNGTR